jgi:hypothetical protein
VQAENLSVMRGETLRGVCLEIARGRHLPIADRDEQEPIAIERQA